MTALGWTLLGIPLSMFLYAYLLYPAILMLRARRRAGPMETPPEPAEWPSISVSLAAYNEEAQIEGAIEALLAADYPSARRQILVISDASTDRTDTIVRGYENRGIELLRLPERGGKTAAENAGAPRLTGDIVICTDASTRVHPKALEKLVRWFADPSVGVASGCNRSVGADGSTANLGESGYVRYEMWVRSLETASGTIVGASGALYATRSQLHRIPVPAPLSRDFAAALVAHESGFRAVSVDDAICLVPRTRSLKAEYRRKVRTMARGLDTLWHKRSLLRPSRGADFAWKLFSHKLCRWLASGTLPLAAVGLAMLAVDSPLAMFMLAAGLLSVAAGLVAIWWPGKSPPPRILSLCGYGVTATSAAVAAWLQALRGKRSPIWEPTRRTSVGRAENS